MIGSLDSCLAGLGIGVQLAPVLLDLLQNAIEIDALEERLHLIATPALRCVQINSGMIIAASRRHHHWT